MGTLIVKDLDHDVVRALEKRAELLGRSVEDVVRDIVERGAPLTPQQRVAIADRVAALQLKPVEATSAELIRQIRDEA